MSDSTAMFTSLPLATVPRLHNKVFSNRDYVTGLSLVSAACMRGWH